MDWKIILLFFLAVLAFFIGDAEGVARGYLYALGSPPKDPMHFKALIFYREHHLRIGSDPGEEYGKLIWQWPTPLDYEPPEGAMGKPPPFAQPMAAAADAISSAAEGKPRGRKPSELWPPTANEYFNTVDEFYAFLKAAKEDIARKDGSFSFLCSNRARPIHESTARSWLKRWGDNTPANNSS